MDRLGCIVAVEGPSGAGKTTVVRAAARSFGWHALPEAFDRIDPRPSLRFRTSKELLALERKLLAEEGLRYGEAVAGRRRGRTVVADTGFLGPLTYTAGLVALGGAPPHVLKALRSLAAERERSHRLGLPDAIVYLDVPARVRHRRVVRESRGHPEEFRERHEAVGRIERRFYRRLARATRSGRVRFVPGTGPPETVAARLRAAVRSLGNRRKSTLTLQSALSLLEGTAGRRPAAGDLRPPPL